MRELAKGIGAGKQRYKSLNLLFFKSKAAIALQRVDDAIPFIQLQLERTQGHQGRRLWIEVYDRAVKVFDVVD